MTVSPDFRRLPIPLAEHPAPNRRILLVAGMPAIHEDFRRILQPAITDVRLDEPEASRFGARPPARDPAFVLDGAFRGEEALAKVRAALLAGQAYALAFVDMHLSPGWDGVQTVEQLWRIDPKLQVVICTSGADPAWDELLKRLDARDRLLILKKPFHPIEVSQMALALTAKWQMGADAALYAEQLDQTLRRADRELMDASTIVHNSATVLYRMRGEPGFPLSYVSANVAYYGYQPEKLVTDPHWAKQVVLPEDMATFGSALARLFDRDAPGGTVEFRTFAGPGQVCWIENRYTPVRDNDGRLVEVEGLLLDITARKAAELELHKQLEQESHHRQILDAISEPILVKGPQSRIVWANAAFRAFYGQSNTQLLGTVEAAFVPPELTQQYVREDAEVFASGKSLEIPVDNVVRFDGAIACWHTVKSPIFDTHGKVVGTVGVSRDITERLQAQEKLRASEAFILAILDSMSALVAVLDPAGVITAVNEPWRRYALDNSAQPGTPAPRTGVGNNYLAICQPEEAPNTDDSGLKMREGILAVISGERPSFTLEYPCHAPGQQFWFSICVTPMGEHNPGVVVVHTDISQRKRAEAALRASQTLLDKTGRIGGVGGWELDVATQTIRWTDETCRIHEVELGHAPTVDEGIAYYAPEARPLITQAVQQCIDTGQGYDLELQLATAKDRPIWVRAVGEAEWADGKVVRLLGAFQDVTARRQAEEEFQRGALATEIALRDSRALLSTLNMHSIVSVADRDGCIVDANDAFCRISGYRREELLGQNHRIINSGVQPRDFWSAMWRDIAIGTPWRGEVCNRAKDGSLYWVDTVIAPFKGGDGKVERYISIRSDITARKATESELLWAIEAANSAARAKDQFLATISHELRTPMNAILGMLTLLRRTELSERQADFAAKTEGAARSLLELLNEMLDFSKIEAGKMTLELRPMRIDQLLRDLSVIVTANVDDKPVSVSFEVDPALSRPLLGDALRLRQVMINLAGNAVKFTDAGRVVVSATVLGRATDGITVEMCVQDTGIGIAHEQQARIFESFTQAEDSTTRRFGGTGLGLAISQRLLRLMGTELELDSIPGLGSRFHFRLRLPLALDRADAVAESSADSRTTAGDPGRRLVGLRLLVADDNPINQEVLRELLGDEGATVQAGNDGRAVVDMLAAQPSRFDAILMDLQMPVLDGLGAARAIRQDLGLAGLPIIALTANAMASDREACLQAGMNDHVSKPFDLDHLVHVLQKHTGRLPGTPGEGLPGGVGHAAAMAGVDIRAALKRMGGKRDLYLRTLQVFTEQLSLVPERLRVELAAGDTLAAAQLMHSLKGLAATVGAADLFQRAGRMQKQLDQSAASSHDAVLVSGLCDAIRSTVPALHELLRLMGGASGYSPRDVDRPSVAWDAPNLGAALRDLVVQLRNADMAATDAMEVLLARFGAGPEDRLAPLHRAVAGLDFERALRLCDDLAAACNAAA